MAKGKIRSEAHLIDRFAVDLIKNKLPQEWVVRELTPDYGLDLDVELFIKESDQIVTLGERLYIQVKGTASAKYKKIKIKKDEFELEKECLVFPLDTALLHLVERMGNSLPVLLVTVDINTKQAFFVCLNDYIDFVLCDDQKWRKQKTKTVYVPCENLIENDGLLRRYALRPKINSFFADAASLKSDLGYTWCPADYLKKVQAFSFRYNESDIWNSIPLGLLFFESARQSMQYVVEEAIHPFAEQLVRDNKFYDCTLQTGHFNNVPSIIAKKLFTADQLMRDIDSANAFYINIRKLFTINNYEALVTL